MKANQVQNSKDIANQPLPPAYEYEYSTGCCGSVSVNRLKVDNLEGIFEIESTEGCCFPPVIYSTGFIKNLTSIERIPPQKNIYVAYFIWLVFGLFGGHRFYLGKYNSGVFYMLTFGGFVIGWLIDACLIPGWVNCSKLYLGVPGRHFNGLYEIQVDPREDKDVVKKLQNS